MTGASGPAVGGTFADAPGRRGPRHAVRALDVGAALTLAGAVLAAVIGRGRPEDFVIATAVLVAVRAWLAPIDLAFAVRVPARTVVIGVLVYAAAMGFIVLTRHHALRTHALDLARQMQRVFAIQNGQLLAQ